MKRMKERMRCALLLPALHATGLPTHATGLPTNIFSIKFSKSQSKPEFSPALLGALLHKSRSLTRCLGVDEQNQQKRMLKIVTERKSMLLVSQYHLSWVQQLRSYHGSALRAPKHITPNNSIFYQ